jgi:parallel beta-helix repeat protein
MIRGVEDCVINDNILLNNNEAAISIEWDSSKVFVYNNIIKENGKGLVIEDAESITVIGNSFWSEGIQLIGNKIDYWKNHNIYDNSINGKPIYYFKSEKDLIVPSDTGQLILADCNNCIVKNLHISNVDYGIQFGYSNNNNIVSNEFYDNICNGISIYASSNNVISDNIIENNLKTGIVIKGSSQNNEITGNNINNNDIGIDIRSGSSITDINNNLIEKNKKKGIVLKGSKNIINRNHFKKNKIGIYIDFSYDNSIIENNFIGHGKFHGFFIVDYSKKHENKWKSNYYGFTLGFLPKLIRGLIKTRYYWEFMPGEKMYFNRPGFNFDWHPRIIPYDIDAIQGCDIV